MTTRDFFRIRAKVFLGNDKFDRTRWSIFREGLRFGVRWLLGWRSRYLFSYRIAIVNGRAYLVGSGVHEQELRGRLGSETQWFDGSRFYGIGATVWTKIRTLADIVSAFRVLRERGELTHLFNFLYNVYVFRVALDYIEEIECQLKPTGYGTFELRYIGEAVRFFCESHGKHSIFVQHGLFDQALCPIRFDEYYIWSEWDKEFFVSEDPFGTFHLKFPSVAKPSAAKIGDSRVLYFALEYPGPTLSRSFILRQVTELIQTAQKMKWTVVLRPHPRDTSNMAALLAARAGDYVRVDPYANLPIVPSFQRNDGAVFVTFNSAAIFEIQNEGFFCVTIKNPLQDYVLIPFSRISRQLESAAGIESILGDLDRAANLTV